ncbi:transcriptional regulator BetI [Profundibacterium mesophilum]|uniref:HTH-type transcriptional regulator BetI n=1 Tax=Profundibacterium mesophilum KAUST100406-0324 TaxID=1037889 RepID=A0A921NV79_9RHOB|nr:transcriptional regulator BetI [Profundibacterium mesophilum]KAF0675414.1 HTH-type transcriptional regulator BetI [Profundibacterium mesophilum KAUST100406-0324]
MPKVGMEPIRRDALVKATITEIGRAGSLDVTVAQIARRAGMSTALAHHYFGGKDKLLLAAMRHILSIYGGGVRGSLRGLTAPEERLRAIVNASFAPVNFRGEVVSAWLNFYVQAQHSAEARRLLCIYQRRLRSNLLHDLRKRTPRDAAGMAETAAALIDGLYIRAALGEEITSETAAMRVLDVLGIR